MIQQVACYSWHAALLMTSVMPPMSCSCHDGLIKMHGNHMHAVRSQDKIVPGVQAWMKIASCQEDNTLPTCRTLQPSALL